MPQQAPAQPRFTYGDYRRWHGDERWELLDGDAHAMSPAPSRLHQQVLTRLAARIVPALEDGPCEVYVAPFDVRLPRGDEPDDEIETVVQPDLSVVCDPGKLDGAGCRGAPDWVIEILSPATEARDRVHKRALYEQHGVREYWLVDPEGRTVTVYRREAETDRFAEPEVLAATGTLAPAVLTRVEVDWVRVIGD